MLSFTQKYYAAFEELLGLLCPSLGTLCLAAHFEALNWSGLLFVWIGCGLCLLPSFGSYPQPPQRPFARGLHTTAVGMLWPLWLAGNRPSSDSLQRRHS